jgi:hypothetical protein
MKKRNDVLQSLDPDRTITAFNNICWVRTYACVMKNGMSGCPTKYQDKEWIKKEKEMY